MASLGAAQRGRQDDDEERDRRSRAAVAAAHVQLIESITSLGGEVDQQPDKAS